jgi:transposase
MRNIKETLRLSQTGLSNRQIAGSLQIAAATVDSYLKRPGAAGLGWPLPEGMDDAGLEAVLFPPAPPSTVQRTPPDFDWVHPRA